MCVLDGAQSTNTAADVWQHGPCVFWWMSIHGIHGPLIRELPSWMKRWSFPAIRVGGVPSHSNHRPRKDHGTESATSAMPCVYGLEAEKAEPTSRTEPTSVLFMHELPGPMWVC